MTLTAAQRSMAERLGIEIDYIDTTGVARECAEAAVLAAIEVLRVDPPSVDEATERDSGEMVTCVRPAFARGSEGGREWGYTTPLWAVRGRNDRGIGTFSDLVEAGEWIAAHGGGVVATLPMLSSFPGEDSPYRPVSRRFWDEVHLDATRLDPTYTGVPVSAIVDRDAVREQLRSSLLPLALRSHADGRRMDDPDRSDYARFRAAGERHGLDWRRWPRGWDGGVPDDAVDPDAVRWHEWVQQQCDAQLAAAHDALRGIDVLLLVDLPVGTHPDGFDRWRHRSLFVDGFSIGAPPDFFNPEGQDWGIAPTHPVHLASIEGRAWFRSMIDHHAALAGLLRIDHVMGLHRQWWVPDGASPTDGVYVRQPAKVLWDEIAASSRAHHTAIVAEDLGTVPPVVREEMGRRQVFGLFVAQSSMHARSTSFAERPAPRTVASFGTHDMPPIARWWAVEGVPDRSLAEGRDEILAQLAASDAAIVLVDAGDVLLDPVQVNVPGTVAATNWTHRMERSLESVRSDPAVSATLDRIERFRHLPDDLVAPMDLHLFNEGTHGDLPSRFGAHPVPGESGVVFSVWAPNARAVSVLGDAAGWDEGQPLARVAGSGIWAGVVAHARAGQLYKFRVTGADGTVVDRADPLARAGEGSPGHASIVDVDRHEWGDGSWMAGRAERQAADRPMSIYEVHLGSWRRGDGGAPLTYRELAGPLADHAVAMGFTHVEFLPVMEHPFTGSWGYQVTGFFQPTARFGTPDDLRFLVDHLHQRGIGVILDWVPAHFPADRFALAVFDGTELYEHSDPREGVHPDWGSLIFNYGRHEVRSFLLSSALWWLESFHVDGLRVDAVASMLYRDYSREPGEWIPNRYGGRENLEAIDLLRYCNDEIHRRFPGVVVAAEESTAWGGVTAPTSSGGLGFDLKWDLGWMHDTLDFLGRDPVHRRWHQDDLTFRQMYASSERFVLPLSHDEVVHGKGSLVGKMAGDDWQQRANLRLLFAWQHVLPGKKLLFMGGEFAQRAEWNHDASLDWHLLQHYSHEGILQWVARLNGLHRDLPALHQLDHDPSGFEWIACDDAANGILVVQRRGLDPLDDVVAILNFTPTVRNDYRIGLPHPGYWDVEVSSDDEQFGGGGQSVPARIEGVEPGADGRPWSATVTAVPLGMVLYRRAR